MDKISTIINIVFMAVFALCAVIGFIRGFKNGFVKSIIGLSATVISIFIATLVLKYVYSLFSDEIDAFALSLVQDSAVSEIFDLSSSALSYVCSAVKSLCLPLCFLIVYLVVSLVVKVIVAIVNKIIKKLLSKNVSFLSRLVGCLISTLAAVVFAAALLSPISGYVNTAAELYSQGVQSENLKEGDKATEVLAQIDESSKNPLIKITYETTSFLYKKTAAIDFNGSTLSFIEEAPVIFDLVLSVGDLKGVNFSDLENLDLTPVEAYVQKANKSGHLAQVLAQITSVAGDKWLKGEAFVGVNVKEQLYEQSPAFTNALDGVLLKLKNCTKDNLVQVVKELGSVAKTLAKTAAYVNKLGEEGISAETLVENMEGILESVTPETVDAVTPFLNSDILEEKGLEKEDASTVSEIIKDTLTSVAEMDEGEKKGEAKAISDLISYVLTEDGAKPSADEIIETLMDSETVMTVIKGASDAEDEKTLNLSYDTKNLIKEAITQYESENAEADEESLEALKKLFGVHDES